MAVDAATPKRPAEEPIYAVAEEVSDGEWAALAKGGEKVAPAAALEPEAEATAVADTAYHPHHDADQLVAEGRALAAEGRPRRGFWADVGGQALVIENRDNPRVIRRPGDHGERDFIYATNNLFSEELRGCYNPPPGQRASHWHLEYWQSTNRNLQSR